MARHDIAGGAKIRHLSNEAVRFGDKVLLILSEDAFASTWVGEEVWIALAKEPSRQRTVLLPI